LDVEGVAMESSGFDATNLRSEVPS
jgi:hypothetical protein